jgi:hypothetical protein
MFKLALVFISEGFGDQCPKGNNQEQNAEEL